jgi:prevent-host-death family protein
MRKLSTAEARESLADIVNDAAYAGKRTIITRRGKEIAAVVPIADLVDASIPAPEGLVVLQVQQATAPLAVTPPNTSSEPPYSITTGGISTKP